MMKTRLRAEVKALYLPNVTLRKVLIRSLPERHILSEKPWISTDGKLHRSWLTQSTDKHSIFLGTALSYINEPSANPNKELNSRYSTPGGSGHADDKRTTETPIKRTMTWNTASSEVPAEILAYAYENDSSLHGEGASANKSFTPIDTNFLNELNKRYPSGTMWTFGEAGLITPTESLPPPSLNRRYSSSGIKTWKQQRESEAEVLRHHFPYVSQLIFAPLFDAALERSTTG